MSNNAPANPGRRRFLGTAAFAIGAAAAPSAFAQDFDAPPAGVKHNISSFRARDWRPYFDSTRNGAILVDLNSRAVHFWSDDLSIYRLYPSSIPVSEDLTRRGRTQVTLKDPSPARGRCTCRGSTTASTARMTRARSAAGRRTAASVFTTSTSKSCSSLRRSARRYW